MSIISLDKVTKKNNDHYDLKNITLNIDTGSKIGIKMPPTITKTLLE